jgi:acetyltransferase-like isoleucine patch superfamily enzyme
VLADLFDMIAVVIVSLSLAIGICRGFPESAIITYYSSNNKTIEFPMKLVGTAKLRNEVISQLQAQSDDTPTPLTVAITIDEIYSQIANLARNNPLPYKCTQDEITFFRSHSPQRLLQVRVGLGTYGFDHIDWHYWGEENVDSIVTIGRYGQIAGNVTILMGGNHFYRRPSQYPFENVVKGYAEKPESYSKGPVTIGNDVWIGHAVTILSGVTIGDGAVLGTGAVVRKDVPPYAIVIGNPAEVVAYRFEPEVIQRLLQLKWWEWDQAKLTQAIPLLKSDDVYDFLMAFEDK